MQRLAQLLVFLIFLFIASSANAVDGVLEINQTCAVQTGCFAGDTAGFPVTISTSGSYRLTGNLLTNSQATTMISITVPQVTLDLNGFRVDACDPGMGACAAGAANAISAPSIDDVTIRNGLVLNSGGDCIQTGESAVIKDVRARACGATGILVGQQSIITNVIVQDAGTNGVYMAADSVLKDCVVSGSGDDGVQIASSGLIENCMLVENQGAIYSQISIFGKVGGYRGCVINHNDGVFVEVQPISGAKDLGGNICGQDTTCP